MQVAAAGEVRPRDGEFIKVNDVTLILDASGSMQAPNKFRYAKPLMRSFVGGMPGGPYESGFISYGGRGDEWTVLRLEPFDRNTLSGSLESSHLIGGLTPLARAIDRAGGDIEPRSGTSAVVVFSDGQAEPVRVLAACKAIIAAKNGDVCFHTVHFGDNADGAALLRDVSALTSCGSARDADAIASAAGMEAFIREVFFGAKPAATTAPILDSDGDGVLDPDDACPGTPKGARVDARGCWVLGGVLFDVDKSVIKPEYQGLLDEVATVLKNNAGVSIRIDGHTDSTASDAYNQGLSERRANSVRDALVSRGVDTGRLSTQGFGESKPIATNDTVDGRQLNRRVELTPR